MTYASDLARNYSDVRRRLFMGAPTRMPEPEIEPVPEPKITPPRRDQYNRIRDRACRVFDVRISELLSDRRETNLVLARQFICYWAARLTPMSMPQIARKLNRDHTTVLHNKKVWRERRAKMGRHLRAVR